MSYGITFVREQHPQTIQFGLRRAATFTSLEQAFDLVADDLLLQPGEDALLPIGELDPSLAGLNLTADTSLTITLEPHSWQGHDDYLLIVQDAYTGSETSTSADTLAEVFTFITRWAEADFA